MKISREDLAKYAERFLGVLNAEGISSWEGLSRVLERSFPVCDGESVWIGLRPSNGLTYAHTLSYVAEGVGIPIEIRLNRDLGYTKVIIKMQEELAKYAVCAMDHLRNMVQERFLEEAGVERARRELEDLAGLRARA